MSVKHFDINTTKQWKLKENEKTKIVWRTKTWDNGWILIVNMFEIFASPDVDGGNKINNVLNLINGDSCYLMSYIAACN